jgi:hypothetical protein
MATDLDALIREARSFEDPSPRDRAVVRRAVELRVAGGLVALSGDGGALAGVAPRRSRTARRAAQRSSVSAGVLPALVFSVLGGVSADLSVSERRDVEASVMSSSASSSAAAERAPASMEPAPPVTAPPAIAALEAESAPAPPALHPSARVTPARRRAPEARASAAEGSAAASTGEKQGNLAAESRALAAVQRALRDGEGELALRLLDAQDREFARGVLGEERAAARVLGSCSAGKTLEAARARAAFEARYPGSALLARVRSGCAASTVR